MLACYQVLVSSQCSSCVVPNAAHLLPQKLMTQRHPVMLQQMLLTTLMMTAKQLQPGRAEKLLSLTLMKRQRILKQLRTLMLCSQNLRLVVVMSIWLKFLAVMMMMSERSSQLKSSLPLPSLFFPLFCPLLKPLAGRQQNQDFCSTCCDTSTVHLAPFSSEDATGSMTCSRLDYVVVDLCMSA